MNRLTNLQLLDILDSVVNQMEDGVIIVDAKADDQPIIFVNRSFCNITGYSQKDVIGKNPRFLVGAETDSKVLEMIKGCITGKETGSTTVLNYKKDGTTFWNYLSLTPINDAGGNISHWVGVERDITYIIEQIQHKSKKQSMETTIRTVNDLVNNFLNSINFLRNAIEDCPDNDKNHLKEFDDVYSKFVFDFRKLNQIEQYKEKEIGNNFPLLDI